MVGDISEVRGNQLSSQIPTALKIIAKVYDYQLLEWSCLLITSYSIAACLKYDERKGNHI